MAVSSDIVRTWRGPRAVMRDLLAMGQREDRAIAYLMAACGIIFVAQWPRLSRKAAGFDLAPGADTPEFGQLVAYEFVAWVMVWPLAFYGIAWISRGVAHLLGGKGTGYGARLALFWALLASAPLFLLHGLMAAFAGPGAGTNLVGLVLVAGFFTIWIQNLRVSEGGGA